MENSLKDQELVIQTPEPTRNLSVKRRKQGLHRLPGILKNKYFISLAAFAGIMLFLDKNDILTQFERRKELHLLQESRQYYTTQIATETKELEALKSNPATLEKYAREKYLMKRDNEELFLIPENPDNSKN